MRLLFQVFLFFLLFLCFTNVLQGQQPVMRQYTAEDGLPGGMVYVTIQDQQGYIWIGTDRGVVRFDGNEFKIFTVKDGLPSNEVWGISEDKTGKLWLDTFNGICYIEGGTVYNLEDELFPKRIGLVNHLLTIVGHYIQLDHSNLFYFSEGGKPQKVTDKSKIEFYLPSDHIITDKLIEDSILQEISANLNLASNQKLIVIKESIVVDTDEKFSLKFNEFYTGSGKPSVNKLHIEVESISKNEILFLFDGQIWRLNNNGLSKEKIDHLIRNEQKDFTVDWIKKIAPNLIWLKTNHGNFIVDSLLQVNPEYDFLLNLQTNNIFIDKQKNLWLSSYNGLLFISQKVQSSRSYTLNSKTQSSSFNFLAVNKKNDIWALNADGYLYQLNIENGLSTFFDFPIMNTPSDLSFDFDDNLWVTGFELTKIPGKYLYEKNLRSKPYEFQTLTTACSRAVKNIHILDEKRFIIASFNCLAEYHHNDENYTSRITGRHYGIAVIDANNFITSGKFGTRKIARKNGRLAQDSIPADNDHPILHLPTNNIAIGSDKIPWLAVNNIGVYRWNNSQMDSIVELANVLVQSLYVDQKQQLWAATNEGLAKIYNIKKSPFSYDFQWFKTKDGLISNDVKSVLCQGKKIIAATNKGITILDEKENNSATTKAPFLFSTLLVNGQEQGLKEHYELTYKENNLLIKYKCLDFKNIGNKVFQHMLIGVDDNWVDNPSFEKEYASLAPGSYTFRLRRKPSSSGETTENPPKELSLYFSINPPFWETTRFSVVVFLLLCSIAYSIYRYQIHKIKARAKAINEQNKKIAKLELNALQSQMNPHFVFNALNAIQDFIFKNDARDANRYLVKFSRLMRLILESSKEKVILLEDEIKLLQLYIDLEELRFEDKFITEIKVGDDFSPALISIPSMLLQPFVENAINHGLIKSTKPGKLLLSFNREGQILHCIIQDNGIGIDKSKENKERYVVGHKSRGMQLVKERQRVWNIIGDTSVKIEIKDLFDAQQDISGTRIDIYITLEQFENDPQN